MKLKQQQQSMNSKIKKWGGGILIQPPSGRRYGLSIFVTASVVLFLYCFHFQFLSVSLHRGIQGKENKKSTAIYI